ncbi:MAG: efflux RND transporter periplasmic adaptor subunit [Alphaproteobacteria bacterium]|nr:efflux RND transporter periplasmic adaptor subunit [Alphaproteobacteria bacterium]
MAFRINKSYLTATLVLVGIGVWMGTGTFSVGGLATANSDAVSIAERQENALQKVSVRVITLKAAERQRQLEIRGRTEADATISVRSETSAIVAERLVNLGDQVMPGDLMCRLNTGAREARVLQAKATLEQTQADYSANLKLQERGFAATNQVAALKAALDSAKAALQEAEQELERIEIRATVAGIVQEPLVENGDLLSVGGVCATLIDTDPMLVTGQVSERDIGNLSIGQQANINLITGESRTGTISYISAAADAATRTFRVDITMPNSDNAIRDGVTATAVIPLKAVSAHLLAPSMLTLSDAGDVGIRLVDLDQGTNQFQKINILGETKEGVWASGLPESITVIAVGQEYVIDGQPVEPVFAEVTQ